MPLQFSEGDVAAFAAASGDRNPLHLDPGYARATPYGGTVVHGALLTLAALGRLDDDVLAQVRAIEATFGGAVLVGEPVEAEADRSPRGDAWQVRLHARGRLLARVVARREPGRGAAEPPPAGDVDAGRPMRDEPRETGAPGELVAGAYAAGGGLASIAAERGAAALPGPLREGLAWASYVVGMEVPGRDGVFAAVKLALLEGAGGRGAYALRVVDRDPRTERLLLAGRLDVAAGGVASATIECFARLPVPALDPRELAGGVRPASGRAVIVVGGSRGFGAATALALQARGHATHVVHSSPRAAAGGEELHAHRADARDAGAMGAVADEVAARGLPLAGIVLAASPPPLPMGVTPASAAAVAAYVADAVGLAAVPLGALLPLLERGGFVVFCSSVAVVDPPRDWPHYVAAKGALEGLAAWTAAAVPGCRSVAVRLPKMLTAMTNLPSMRSGATRPEPVALRLVELLEPDGVGHGLTLLQEELLP